MDYRQVLQTGTVLDGKYRIERVIGSGGFGITYEAFDIGLSAPVAIKEYYPSQFGLRDASMSVRPRSERDVELFERLKASFLREARTLNQFEHSAIVRVLTVFEAHGTAYMVMKYETGPSLKAWLSNLVRFPTQAELDRLAIPLLDALEMMHRAEFLHRDIAPDNIIVRADGSPVLLDFGASRRVMGEMTGTLTGVVKKGYSPQEQYATDSRSQGPWTDIYAMGATLYRCVTGETPFEATERMLDDRIHRAADLAAGRYRQPFLEAIDAAMALRPKDRPQSIAEWRPMLLEGLIAPPGQPQSWPSIDQAAGYGASETLIATGPQSRPRQTGPRAGVAASQPRSHPSAPRHSGPGGLAGPPQGPAADPYAQSPAPSRNTAAIGLVASALLLVGGGATLIALNRGSTPRPPEPPQQTRPVVPPAAPVEDRAARAAREWARLASSDNRAELERFAANFGDTPSGAEARARLAAIDARIARFAEADREWQRISATADVGELQRFIDRFPDTPSAGLARTRQDALRTQLARNSEAAREWERVSGTTDIAVLQRFLATWGDTPSAAPARTRLAALQSQAARNDEAAREWARLTSSSDIDALQRFVNIYSDTPSAAPARARLDTLQREIARQARALQEWTRLEQSRDIAAIERFLREYGDTASAPAARVRLTALQREIARTETAAREWARIAASRDQAAIERFAREYADTPSGSEAHARLAELRRVAALAAEGARQWQQLQSSEDLTLIERFLATYGETPSGELARQRLASLRALFDHRARALREWANLSASEDVDAIRRFLVTYGDTPIASAARQRLTDLEAGRQLRIAMQEATRAQEEADRARLAQRPRQLAFAPPGSGTRMFPAVALANSDLIVAGGSGGAVRIWDSANGTPRELRGPQHSDVVSALAISPDGRNVVSGAWRGEIIVWSLDGSARVYQAADPAANGDGARRWIVTANFVSPTRFVTLLSDGHLQTWDITTPARAVSQIRLASTTITSGLISRDGSLVLTGAEDGTTSVWNAASGQLQRSLPRHGDWVFALAQSDAGTLLATAGADGIARVHDLSDQRSPQRHELRAHETAIRSIAVAGNGSRIATGGEDGSIVVWDAATGARLTVLRDHNRSVRSLNLSADGQRLVSASEDGDVRVWYLDTLVQAQAPPRTNPR